MEDLVAGSVVIPAAEIEERFETPGGPGGQHANRNATAVRVRFRVPESSLPEPVKQRLISKLGEVVEATAGESRSQVRNREVARRRLASRIEGALTEPKPRRRTRPTRAAKQRRLTAKKARSEIKRQRRRPTDFD
ncbi:MAG: alternative ribosome rescue aminoacyl-tRNA hydrolase ArfB [Acidimicrobiia bacterium]